MNARGAGAPEPWDRLGEETSRAVEAFRTYLELGPRRSLRRLTERGQDEDAPRFRWGSVAEWSAKYRWQERAAAWDDHVARQEEEAFLGENRRRARRMARISEAHGEVLSRPGQEVLRRIGEDPGLLARLPLATLLELSVKAARAHPRVVQAERLSRGMSTDAPGRADDDRFSRMNLDELDAYLAGVDDGGRVGGDWTENG